MLYLLIRFTVSKPEHRHTGRACLIVPFIVLCILHHGQSVPSPVVVKCIAGEAQFPLSVPGISGSNSPSAASRSSLCSLCVTVECAINLK